MARRGRRWAGFPEPGRQINDVGRCMEHGKECFKTRRAARQVNNQFHDRHRSVYTCTETGFFHIGGLPTSVVRGSVTRKEIYEDNEEAA